MAELNMSFLYKVWNIYNTGKFVGTCKLPRFFNSWNSFPAGSIIPINYRGKIYHCKIESLWDADYYFVNGGIENLEI